MRVAGGGAIRDHRNRLGGGVGGGVEDFDIEHRRQAAKALCADAEIVHRVV